MIARDCRKVHLLQVVIARDCRKVHLLQVMIARDNLFQSIVHLPLQLSIRTRRPARLGRSGCCCSQSQSVRQSAQRRVRMLSIASSGFRVNSSDRGGGGGKFICIRCNCQGASFESDEPALWVHFLSLYSMHAITAFSAAETRPSCGRSFAASATESHRRRSVASRWA